MGYFSQTLVPGDATAIVGFGYLVSHVDAIGTTGFQLCSIRDGATSQVSLRLNQDLTLSVVRGEHNGTVLGTTSVGISAASYFFIEMKVTIHASAGTVDVWINGVNRLSLTAQNTRNTAIAQWNVFSLGMQFSVAGNNGGNFRTADWDDVYVLDGTGAAPWNGALGDVRVDYSPVTAASVNGAPNTQWTPSAGSNYQNVDDAAPNDDTDYNTGLTVGVLDTFVVQDAPANSTVYGVQVNLSFKKTDVGICSVAAAARHAGADYVGSDMAGGTMYAYGRQVWPTNPGTLAQWTEAGFNAAEFGYKRTV